MTMKPPRWSHRSAWRRSMPSTGCCTAGAWPSAPAAQLLPEPGWRARAATRLYCQVPLPAAACWAAATALGSMSTSSARAVGLQAQVWKGMHGEGLALP